MSHEWVMPQIRISESCHVRLCHVAHKNESRHSHDQGKSHTCIGQVTHMNQPQNTLRPVSFQWMNQVTHTNGSYHIHERVKSNTRMSHKAPWAVSPSNQAYPVSESNANAASETASVLPCFPTAKFFYMPLRILATKDTFICVACLVQIHDMPHSYVWHASLIRATCPIRKCNVLQSYVRLASFMRVTCLIHMCDMPHLYVKRSSFTCMTCLNHMCETPHSYVWHWPFMRHYFVSLEKAHSTSTV
jgi:hypothetical protein